MAKIEDDSLVKGKRSGDVLETAYKMFSHAAIDSISMTDIAEEAHIGVATIYRYFGTKQNLVILAGAYALRSRVSLVMQRFEEQEMAQRSGLEQIEFLLMGFAQDYESQIDLLRFATNVDQYFLNEDTNKEGLAPYAAAMQPVFDLFYHAFDLANEQGDVVPEYCDRQYQNCCVMALMGAAQKYAANSLFCGDDIEAHRNWLIWQVKMTLHFLGGGVPFSAWLQHVALRGAMRRDAWLEAQLQAVCGIALQALQG